MIQSKHGQAPHAAHTTACAVDANELALTRTFMAANRTLMAWVRTGISQISFGFSIYKVLQSFSAEGQLNTHRKLLTPEIVGAVLVILGIVGIIFGMVEYRGTLRQYGHSSKGLPIVMSGLIAFLGISLLTAIFFHL